MLLKDASHQDNITFLGDPGCLAKTTFHLLLSDCGAEGRGSPQDVTPSILVKLHRDLTRVFIPNGGLVWENPGILHGFQKFGYPKMDGL